MGRVGSTAVIGRQMSTTTCHHGAHFGLCTRCLLSRQAVTKLCQYGDSPRFTSVVVASNTCQIVWVTSSGCSGFAGVTGLIDAVGLCVSSNVTIMQGRVQILPSCTAWWYAVSLKLADLHRRLWLVVADWQ